MAHAQELKPLGHLALWNHHQHHHQHHTGFLFVFGLAAPHAYYGGDCYVRRVVHINRWGERVVRRVRVCD